MKKLLAMILMATTQIHTGYIAQNGPVELGDQVQVNQITSIRYVVRRGVIMNSIMTNPDFAEDLNNVLRFLNIGNIQNLPSYEEIVNNLKISTNSYGAVAVIEAFEKAIMRYLHYNHYIFSIEGKRINIFFTGIKYSWFYPSEWINPESWLSGYTSFEIAQLMAELDQLANIAARHSLPTSWRIKAKINAYRNWKTNSLITAAVVGTIAAGVYLTNK